MGGPKPALLFLLFFLKERVNMSKNWGKTKNGRAYYKAYRCSPEGKAYQKAYNQKYTRSIQGKICRKAYDRSYQNMVLRKIRQKKYDQTPKGKLSIRKRHINHQRLGNKILNPELIGVVGFDGHHVDKEHVLFIPRELHRRIHHSQSNKDSMNRINSAAFAWLLGAL